MGQLQIEAVPRCRKSRDVLSSQSGACSGMAVRVAYAFARQLDFDHDGALSTRRRQAPQCNADIPAAYLGRGREKREVVQRRDCRPAQTAGVLADRPNAPAMVSHREGCVDAGPRVKLRREVRGVRQVSSGSGIPREHKARRSSKSDGCSTSS